MMKEQGTSLVEILLLVGLLALILVMAVTKVTASDPMTIDSEAAFFVSRLRYLQELSCTTQRFYAEFPSAGGEGAPSFSVQPQECHILQDGRPQERHWYPARMTAYADRTDIFFASDGTATPVTITLALGHERRYVIVDIVGRVRISK